MTMDRHDLISVKLGDYVLDDVTPEERGEIEQHLRDCDACATELAELRLVMEGLARVPEPVIPPAALKLRVLASISGTGAQGRIGTSTPRGWNAGWLAAAAAVILVLGGSLYVAQGRARQASEELRLADAEIAELTTRLDDFAGQTDLALSILTASDMQRIELAGSAAGARAYWSAARGLLVAADQLPVPPPGRIFQVWLIGGGAPVSAGLLGTPRTGRGMLIAPPPGGIARGPVTIAVTDEPVGGLPAPTGSKHFVGSI